MLLIVVENESVVPVSPPGVIQASQPGTGKPNGLSFAVTPEGPPHRNSPNRAAYRYPCLNLVFNPIEDALQSAESAVFSTGNGLRRPGGARSYCARIATTASSWGQIGSAILVGALHWRGKPIKANVLSIASSGTPFVPAAWPRRHQRDQ